MTVEQIHQALLKQFGDGVIPGANLDAIDPWIEIAAG